MHYRAWGASLLGVALLLILSLGSAQAQATRTWVSGVGDDVNPCSRTAPCKTFAGAISKTAAGGEISVLDPGGFGAVTITKSISIVNDNSGEAGILASLTNGVIINGAGVIVHLRGLFIHGGTPGQAGLNGIRFINGASLVVEKCTIRNFTATNAFGINFQPTANARLMVLNSTITNNGNGATGGGIQVIASGSAGVNAVLSDVRVSNNAGVGIRVDGAGSTNALNLTVSGSVVAENTGNGITAISPGGGAAVKAMVNDTTIAGNTGIGVNANGAAANGAGSALALIGNSTIALNGTGVSATGAGVLQSFKNNQIAGNVTDGTPITAFPGPGATPLQ